MQSKLTDTPLQKKQGWGGGAPALVCLWIYVRYINGDTIAVGNDLKIGGVGKAKKEILPQFPMPF